MAFALDRACTGILRGFLLTARFYTGGDATPPFCAPPWADAELVREVFLDWAAAHPGRGHQSEILSLHQAMAAGFSCKG